MPEFEPTEYLFREHADKGKERWEVAAWAMREAMSKTSGLSKCDTPLRWKRTYEYWMRDLPDSKHPKEIYADYLKSLGDETAAAKTE